MTRSSCVAVILVMCLGSAQAQVGEYNPLPTGAGDPESLNRLAALLGQGNPAPPFDPKMLKLVEDFLKSTENDPAARQRLLEMGRQQAKDNPELLKRSNPNLNNDDLKKLAEGLGKPGEPMPQLPKPGSRPPLPQPNPVGTPANPPLPGQKFPGQPPSQSQFPNQPRSGKQPGRGDPNSEQVQGAVQMWEQSVGPIDSTPAVKDAIIDLFGNGTGGPNERPFWDNPDFDGGQSTKATSNSSTWNFLKGSNWTAPNWLKNINSPSSSTPTAPQSSFNGPSAPSFGGFGSVGLAGMGTVGTVILVLIIGAVIGFLIWKFLPLIQEARNRRLQPLPGQGPWPVDPRTIRDRPGLVLAFEYLSILVCGNGAVVWNHLTIAEALRNALPDREHLAEPLARLYAVARYTPLREEIPESAYAEARHCLCQLAGVAEV